jgi:hypothetical protein
MTSVAGGTILRRGQRIPRAVTSNTSQPTSPLPKSSTTSPSTGVLCTTPRGVSRPVSPSNSRTPHPPDPLHAGHAPCPRGRPPGQDATLLTPAPQCHPHLRQLETRNIFARQAKVFLDHEGMNPNVATVQGLAHLASFHSSNEEHNLGWLLIGMVSRCAYARESWPLGFG